MKHVLLCLAFLAGLIQSIGWAAAQPAVSAAPRMPNGADIPSTVQLCYNYTTAAFQYCPYYSASGNTYTSSGSMNVNVTNFPATQPVSGSVSVSNFPATQPVSGPVADSNSAAFQGVVVITPGTAVAAARSIGYVITAAGNATFTLADGSTITLALTVSTIFQVLPFAVTNVALGTGTAGSFWNLK